MEPGKKGVDWVAARKTFRSYSALIVGVPAMVVIHLAWFRLQENELFVPKDPRNPPIMEKYKLFIADIRRRVFSWTRPNSGNVNE